MQIERIAQIQKFAFQAARERSLARSKMIVDCTLFLIMGKNNKSHYGLSWFRAYRWLFRVRKGEAETLKRLFWSNAQSKCCISLSFAKEDCTDRMSEITMSATAQHVNLHTDLCGVYVNLPRRGQNFSLNWAS